MRRLNEFVSEDSNQFGPGTDLVIAMMGVLLVMILVSGRMYSRERKQMRAEASGGNFRLASSQFLPGTFESWPVERLKNPSYTAELVGRIVAEYDTLRGEFPTIFVIGHANQLGDRNADDSSPTAAKLRNNWLYGARRASVIAELIQSRLPTEQREKIVVVTTGEFDLKDPAHPNSQENAVVEVVFGKDWKRPARLLHLGPGSQ